MINLDADSRLAKWFVWICDHLPLTVGDYTVNGSDGEEERKYRTGEHYLTAGTTLCHVFWAVLWVPLLGAAAFGFLASMIVMMHVVAPFFGAI
jgi:hypothetical protein